LAINEVAELFYHFSEGNNFYLKEKGKIMKRNFYYMFMLLTILLFVFNAYSQNLMDNVSIHGFGGWAFGQTDGNSYGVGNKDGNYDHFEFALNIAVAPIEKLSIHAQPFWEKKTGILLTDMDYVFANWHFSDIFNFRIGKIKSPFGLYSEIHHVGTLRPFLMLPQSMYGAPGFVQKAYNGIGLTGSIYFFKNWEIIYDIYAGQVDLESIGNRFAIQPQYADIDMDIFARKLIGGRLSCNLPIDGLKFSFAGSSGDIFFTDSGKEIENFFIKDKHYLYSLNAEYLSYHWWIRFEYLHFDKWEGKDAELNCGYIEAAFRFMQKWQIACLYNWEELINNIPGIQLPEIVSPLLEHDEWAFGLNYWFSSNFVLKFSYHHVKGNFFADPGQSLLGIILGADFNDKTELFLFGAHFSF
jgi:hypothetical protein